MTLILEKPFISQDVIFEGNIFPFKFPKGKFLSSQHGSSTSIPATTSDTFSPFPTLDHVSVSSTLEPHASLPSYPITNLPASPSEPNSPLLTTNSFPSAKSIPSDILPSSFPMDLATSAELGPPALPDLSQPRKLGRTSKPQICLTDYVNPPLQSNSSTSHPIQQFVSYTHSLLLLKHFLPYFILLLNHPLFIKIVRMTGWLKL